MVSFLMRKHVRPLGRGRAAGNDGARVHSAQFRKFQTPEIQPVMTSGVNFYIHEYRTNRTTECPQRRKFNPLFITAILL